MKIFKASAAGWFALLWPLARAHGASPAAASSPSGTNEQPPPFASAGTQDIGVFPSCSSLVDGHAPSLPIEFVPRSTIIFPYAISCATPVARSIALVLLLLFSFFFGSSYSLLATPPFFLCLFC